MKLRETAPLASADRLADEAARIRRSGLFDAPWYVGLNADVLADDEDPLDHFLREGWRQGLWPNPYFDTGHYLAQNPAVARGGICPLSHYLSEGEAAGCAPAAYFDLLWYRARHVAAPGETLLRHFLDRRLSGTVSPLPEFDPAWYLATYPDIAAAGIDPFEHYLRWGFREGRNPSASFDTRFYLQRYLDNDPAQNPLLHYRAFRHILRLHPQLPPHEHAVFDEVRRFTRPGPAFETRIALPRTAPRRARLLAYYLPQFHQVAENDAWWGEGFTEWNSVGRGQPRFLGHYQPRIPRDLGHYRLDGTDTLRRQIDMARDAGLFGFITYFYWFNGRRLLERPLEAFLADRTLAFPFCLMWANENWTRRWDGSDHEVLISQDYRAADEPALIDAFARHFCDPRYIRVAGRPLLMVYRAGHIPDTARTVLRWRRLWRERHGEAPLLVMAQSFDDADPRPYGFDAAIEFPPHKLTQAAPVSGGHVFLDPRANPQIFSYADIVAASLAEPAPPFPLIKTVLPGWDNDARREGQGMVIHGATPTAYQAWLEALIERGGGSSPLPVREGTGEGGPRHDLAGSRAPRRYRRAGAGATPPPSPPARGGEKEAPVPDERGAGNKAPSSLGGEGWTRPDLAGSLAPKRRCRAGAAATPPPSPPARGGRKEDADIRPFICINAWNEWAEGAYLEPDVHFGAAFLNATGRAVTRLPGAAEPGRLLLVGHDAFAAGAQMLLLHLGRALRRMFGVAVEFLLLGAGALLGEYEAVAPTQVVGEAAGLAGALVGFQARGCTAAIVNTAAAAHAVPALQAIGVPTTLLIHELPRLLAERGLMRAAWAGMAASRRVVVPSAVSRDALLAAGAPDAPWLVLPQGCYRTMVAAPDARAALRRRLAVGARTRLMLAAGYADLRKGLDVFLQVWRAAQRHGGRVAFCWIGAFDPATRAQLAPEIAAAEATGLFHAPGHQDDPAPWFAAADVFLLTSREDPFPSVVLEALSAGLPVVAFDGGGGIPDLLAATGGGVSVAMADADAMARAALALPRGAAPRDRRAEWMRRRFAFGAYAAALVAEAWPDLPSISVAVPNCDYAGYLPQRLASVFAQTHPVREVLLLDDASTDNSLSVARHIAADWRRDLAIIESPIRSGSPFGQWRRAAAAACGEFLWIAEADDEADPALLARLAAAARLTPDIILATCDSRSVDAAGAPIWPSYQGYFAQCGATGLDRDAVVPARDFARRFLSERNLLLNASAVLWRRAALLAALDRCGKELLTWRAAGDWRVYLEVLAASEGHVAWVAAPLNVHRRHQGSASAAVPRRALVAEVGRMHGLLAERLDLAADDLVRQAAYRRLLRRGMSRPRTAAS